MKVRVGVKDDELVVSSPHTAAPLGDRPPLPFSVSCLSQRKGATKVDQEPPLLSVVGRGHFCGDRSGSKEELTPPVCCLQCCHPM